MKRTSWAAVLLIATLQAIALQAQQVATDPASTHIFPAGGRRGTKVQVRVGGECLPPETRLRISNPVIHAPATLGRRAVPSGEPSMRRRPGELHVNYPKEWESEFTIDADAPIGSHFWWLACARGGTAARVFVVGDDPELFEIESNSNPGSAQSLTVPVTLNGQICGERDMDYFSVSAPAGEVLIADVMATRLGSPLETVLEFQSKTGQRIAAREIRVGGDPVIALQVPADGSIVMSVANLAAAGGPNFVYRINLSTEPYVRFAYPNSISIDDAPELNLFTLSTTDAFQILRQPVGIPSQAGRYWWRGKGIQPAIPLERVACAVAVETTDNDDRSRAQIVNYPLMVHGRLESPGDEDWFAFKVPAGEVLTVRCLQAGIGLPTLPIISVHDANGDELARASAIDEPADRRPAIESWSAPADGTYYLRVRDVQQSSAGSASSASSASSAPDFAYRISIQKAEPDFALLAKTGTVNHLPGSKTELELMVRRLGGYTGPITVAPDHLPGGILAEPLEIPADALSAKLVLVSTAEHAPVTDDELIQWMATAQIGGKMVSHTVNVPHLGRDAEGVSIGDSLIPWFHLTVQHPPLFRLFCSEAYQYAHRGTIHKYQMQVERHRGFNGPIQLQIADRQNKDLDGVEIVEVTIPEGENQILLPLFLPETMHINVQAHSNVYVQGIAHFQDTRGKPQSTCIVSEMRCMIRTLPTVVALRPAERELDFGSDDRLVCRLNVDRTSLFEGPMSVSLLAPCDGLEIEPVKIEAGATETFVVVRRKTKTTPKTIRFRAIGELDGQTQVVAEASVVIRE